jgi:Chalcone isomerase-like
MWSSSRWCAVKAARRRCAALVLLGLLAPPAFGLVPPSPAAADIVPADLPEAVVAALAQPVVLGSGRLTWFGLHIYDARLLAAAPFDVAAWFDQPLALELTYARSVSGARIAQSSHDELDRLGVGNAAQRDRWRRDMVRLFPDVARGSRLLGLYRPGTGVQFFADGVPLGSIDDPQFARGFFMIWLDARTQAPRLRADLLGAAAPGAVQR